MIHEVKYNLERGRRRCCVWASLLSCECCTFNCDVYTGGVGGGVFVCARIQLRKNAEMLIAQAINQFSAGTATQQTHGNKGSWVWLWGGGCITGIPTGKALNNNLPLPPQTPYT